MIALSTLCTMLAWVPLLEPIPIHSAPLHLLLLLPLTLAIAIVYRTLKMPTLEYLGVRVLQLMLTIVTVMALAAVVLWFIVDPIRRGL